MARPGLLTSGYGPPDGRCVLCSFRSDCMSFQQVNVVSLGRALRIRSWSICSATSGGQRRNPDFSRQNRHGFSRNRNRQSEERDGADNIEEPEVFSSKNGPVYTNPGSPKYQATPTPGAKEKEIVELFRKVQAQLRERAASKEEKEVDSTQKQSKQDETVDSLLKLLRKHSVQQGKRNSNTGNSKDFMDQPEQIEPVHEDKSRSPRPFSSNNTLKVEAHERDRPVVSRPASKFQRRSPVPTVRYQPIYPDNLDTERRESRIEPEPENEPKPKIKTEVEPEAEPFLINGDVFDDISDDESSEIDESTNEDDDLVEENLMASTDFSGMKLAELRSLAKARGLKGYSKMKKGELVELLASGTF